MQGMTESVSKEFAQSKNGVQQLGLTGLTRQLSYPLPGLLLQFSKVSGQPPEAVVSGDVVTTPYY